MHFHLETFYSINDKLELFQSDNHFKS